MGNDSERFPICSREYDWEKVEPAVAIIESIAELEDEETTLTSSVLDKPLQAYVDIDALKTLLQSESVPFITLRISHYNIQIRENTLEVYRIGGT